MNIQNRICIYAAYLLGMSGIGFTLPYLSLYLRQEQISDTAIGFISSLAALSGLAQFPIGIWSDRVGRAKPFLVLILAVLTISTWLLYGAAGAIWLSILVILFAENGICRATLDSLFGAEVARQAEPSQVATELGTLRFWKPVGIIAVAAIGSLIVQRWGVRAILPFLVVLQGLAVVAALMIREPSLTASQHTNDLPTDAVSKTNSLGLADRTLWIFILAMILFHAANAPSGIYLGLFLTSELDASASSLSYAFVISMVAWMVVARPCGALADRIGRRPLLIVGWSLMTLRCFLFSISQSVTHVLLIQVLDGLAQGMFIVTAAAWVTDRLADSRRIGEAQAIVGTSLVAGSALGPALSGLIIGNLGYRTMFVALGVIGMIATVLIGLFIPEVEKQSSSTVSEKLQTNLS